jgi:hypothetical protein
MHPRSLISVVRHIRTEHVHGSSRFRCCAIARIYTLLTVTLCIKGFTLVYTEKTSELGAVRRLVTREVPPRGRGPPIFRSIGHAMWGRRGTRRRGETGPRAHGGLC